MSKHDSRKRGSLLFYSPFEVCAVVDLGDVTPDTLASHYLNTLDALNAAIDYLPEAMAARSAGQSPAPTRRDKLSRQERLARAMQAFHADLEPDDAFREFLNGSRPVLRPLPIPSDEQRKAGAELPWVALPVVRGAGEKPLAGGTQICFYGVGDASERFGIGPESGDKRSPTQIEAEEDGLATRMRIVRHLVKQLNLKANRPPHVRAVTPNWFSAAAGETCPGPGAKPAPVPPGEDEGKGRWTFRFANPVVDGLVEQQRQKADQPSDVVVAILDTSPKAREVAGAAGRYADNLLLHDVSTDLGMRIDGSEVRPDGVRLSRPRRSFSRLDGIVANWRENYHQAAGALPTLKMDDHGLFATGIVYDIAPRAEIHLIRALSGFGVSDLQHLLPTLKALPDMFLPPDQPQRRLVINLSLGTAIPPGPEILREWLRETYQELEDLIGQYPDLEVALDDLNLPDVRQMLDDLKRAVTEVIDVLKVHPKVLVVAAAGNDNEFFKKLPPDGELPRRPEPRFPARYDGALGVAAIGLRGQPAFYSNRGDVREIGNGVATFGGDARPLGRPGEVLGTIDTHVPEDQIDAIRGLYCGNPVLLDGGPNETGWVYWAGTSFATPIISALAASVWADPTYRDWPGSDPADLANGLARSIIGVVVKYLARPNSGDANNPERLDCPSIRAWQEWVPY